MLENKIEWNIYKPICQGSTKEKGKKSNIYLWAPLICKHWFQQRKDKHLKFSQLDRKEFSRDF